jgi:hypothetical protein
MIVMKEEAYTWCLLEAPHGAGHMGKHQVGQRAKVENLA